MSYRFMMMPERGLLHGYLTPLLTIGIFLFLVFIGLINWWYRGRVDNGYVMANEITMLDGIFKKIHASCKILTFDNQKTNINFLNVKKDGFVGSEIGSMNMAYPEKWEGPYVTENPKMFDHEYLVVRTAKGHFITPGEGVQLPNGKVIGKDILLDENADIVAMMQNENQLRFKGKPLAAIIEMK